jgi:1,2-dihydroxy-3-keto-5-methylthiopentene dioxygenase
MACLTIPEQHKRITDVAESLSYLKPYGIWYERWAVERGVPPTAPADAILAAFAPEIEVLKQRGGYVTADVIDVTPELPGLQEMLNRFNKEHTHAEDEVRFIVNGSGIFHIHPQQGPVFGLQMEAGDMINVPAGTRHWFDLCSTRTIRAIRLFREKSGWTPMYVNDGVHDSYQPICFGPQYVKPQ